MDKFTKGILTVIAVGIIGLNVQMVNGGGFFTKAHAVGNVQKVTICDESTYTEFDIFQYIDENDYHIIQYAEGITGQGNRCGLRKDYQFGDWSRLDSSGKPTFNTSGNFSYTLRKCIKYVLEDFCLSEFRSYDIYSFSKKGWKYECRINQSLFGPNIVKQAEKYVKKLNMLN